jgi:hypothetical protein
VVSTPFLTQTRTTSTHDPFGVTNAMANAAQRRRGIQTELQRLPPSGGGWVERRRRRLLADFVFATEQELAR